MPLIKLNRINKGGEIVIASEQVVFIEVESRTTTIHMDGGMLFSVEETLDAIMQKVETIEAERIRKGMLETDRGG